MSDFSANIKAILDTSKIPSQIEKIENTSITLKKFTLDTKGLPSQIQASLDSHNFTINLTGIKTNNLTNQMQSAGNQAGQAFSQSLVNNINTKINTGGIEASIAKVNAQYNKLGTTGHSKLEIIKNDISELNNLHNKMKSKEGADLVATYDEFNNTLLKVKNNLTIVSSEAKGFASSLDIKTLDNEIESWLKKNTAASKDFGERLQHLRAELNSLDTSSDESAQALRQIRQEFKQVKVEAEAAGKTGKTFASTFKGAFQSISKYVGASTLIYSTINALKNGIQEVITLDTALVDLQKTTDATSVELQEFYYSANDIAKALGSTTQEVIQTAAEWSRLGYSIQDAQTMAETSSIFASISPDMDISAATNGLISAMKAFDIEAEDALDGIASKINAIGNTQAVDNLDIVNVLTRSSSAMKEANNTLEETIALGTAAVEITRDAESVGNAMKTKFYKNCLCA